MSDVCVESNGVLVTYEVFCSFTNVPVGEAVHCEPLESSSSNFPIPYRGRRGLSCRIKFVAWNKSPIYIFGHFSPRLLKVLSPYFIHIFRHYGVQLQTKTWTTSPARGWGLGTRLQTTGYLTRDRNKIHY